MPSTHNPTTRTLRHKILISTVKDPQLTGAQFPDFRRHLLDQITIMGNEQDRAFELVEHGLQYFLRGQVEVIGRLVEQQQVRPL